MSLFLVLQENHFHPNNLLLHFGGFCILLGTQDITHKMLVHKCTQCSSWERIMCIPGLPFPVESFKLYSIVWGVSVMFILLHLTPSTLFIPLWFLLLNSVSSLFRADLHDYHHCLLYTKSANYSSTPYLHGLVCIGHILLKSLAFLMLKKIERTIEYRGNCITLPHKQVELYIIYSRVTQPIRLFSYKIKWT